MHVSVRIHSHRSLMFLRLLFIPDWVVLNKPPNLLVSRYTRKTVRKTSKLPEVKTFPIPRTPKAQQPPNKKPTTAYMPLESPKPYKP